MYTRLSARCTIASRTIKFVCQSITISSLSVTFQQISEHIIRLVAFLKRDEGPETVKDGEVASDTTRDPEDQDEDMQIVEI